MRNKVAADVAMITSAIVIVVLTLGQCMHKNKAVDLNTIVKDGPTAQLIDPLGANGGLLRLSLASVEGNNLVLWLQDASGKTIGVKMDAKTALGFANVINSWVKIEPEPTAVPTEKIWEGANYTPTTGGQ